MPASLQRTNGNPGRGRVKKAALVFITASICGIGTSRFEHANAADQQQIDQVVSVIERFCLSGSAYRFQADAAGNLKLTSLRPGGKGSISANITKDRGAVGYIKEEIRKDVDADTRKCMEPYIDQIIQLILTDKRATYPDLNTYWAMATMPASTSCAVIRNDPTQSKFDIWNENGVHNYAEWIAGSSTPTFKTSDFAGGERAFFLASGHDQGRDEIRFEDRSIWLRVSPTGDGLCTPR